jgi:hypothetical protein
MEVVPIRRSRTVLASSIALHALIIFILFHFVKCDSAPPPPPPVIELELSGDWGTLNEGMGETESANPSETPSENPSSEQSPVTPSTSNTPELANQETSTISTPKGSKGNQTTTEPKTSKASSIIKNSGKSEGGGSDGNETGVGNIGNPDGLLEGKGMFGGGGWSLIGGDLKKKPESELPTETGKVVVDIWVDKDGNVVEAVINAPAGNTTSTNLFNIAKKAAFTAKFTPRTDGSSAKRKGTLTFNYKLN